MVVDDRIGEGRLVSRFGSWVTGRVRGDGPAEGGRSHSSNGEIQIIDNSAEIQ